MNPADLRRRADAVRDTPLEMVLTCRGALRDKRDRSKWHTEQGSLSITGPKFINWQQSQGGGGAIDLVMHLGKLDFRDAVAWLEQHVAVSCATAAPSSRQSLPKNSPTRFQLPDPNSWMLARVRRYLMQQRGLAPSLLQPLIESGTLYADNRANAVFVLVTGKPNRPVGAELRGTGPRIWRGMTPGSRKNDGFFWIGETPAQRIVLCESAIDAISCHQLHPDRICISTSGVRANPPWLATLHARGYQICCGFDADQPGDAAASAMADIYPNVQRLRPPAHDWNDVLASAK